jgi:hypothetical protein
LHTVYKYMKSVQKCRNLIRCGISSSEDDISKIAQLVSEASAFYNSKAIFHLLMQ